MSPLLMKAVLAITAALICYTVGVWSERRAKILKPWHLGFFWAGFVLDATGTRMMSLLSSAETGNQGALMSLHGITGMAAILLMLIHAVWATVVLVRRDEQALQTFHRFSLLVWLIWLIPFVLGMAMGMGGR